MRDEASDAAIAVQIKDVVRLLGIHDLEGAELGGNALSEQLKPNAAESVQSRRLRNLRDRLDSGIRHIRRAAPLSALIRFREALRDWLV
jgi:hypothetical protein